MNIILELTDQEYPLEYIDHTRRISRGVVINEKNEIALNKLYFLDIFGQRDYYELPGGGIKDGESPGEAFRREIIEEVGYDTDTVRELGIVHDYYNLIHRENYNHYFLARTTDYLGQRLEEKERLYIERLVWVSIDEAIEIYTNMKDHKISGLVKRRELPILLLAKEYLTERI